MILSIIQSLPNHPQHVVLTDSFAKFQQVCGRIELNSYFAAHASCHASMNGIERVQTIDADIHDRNSIQSAIEKLFHADSFDALVIPGLTDFEMQKYICGLCQKYLSASPFVLFLDAEKNSTISDIVQKQQALPRFARYAWPWILTLTPGRRANEWLPASCVIAPLALGKAKYLRGVHDSVSISDSDAASLSKNDIEVLINKIENRRPVIGLYRSVHAESESRPQAFVEVPGIFKDPDPVKPKPDEKITEDALSAELQDRCDDIIRQYVTNGPDLWSALERTAISILNDARSRGKIVNFHVRCDAETASWGTPEKPVVEVLIEYPKRVKEIKFNWK